MSLIRHSMVHINFAQPFAFFTPQAVSFTIFIVVLLLLRVHSIPKSRFVPLLSVLILAMYLTHVAEAVIFVILIGVYSLLSKKSKTKTDSSLRLDDALFSSLIAFILASIVVAYELSIWPLELGDTEPNIIAVASIFPALFAGVCIAWRSEIISKYSLTARKWLGKNRTSMVISSMNRNQRIYLIFSILLIGIFLLGLFTSVYIEGFKTSSVYKTGFTPWFIYPLMLGIVGLLALLSIRHLNGIPSNYRSIIIMILTFILILLVLGRIISFVNLNFALSGYWEKRFILYIFLFACLLAPIPLIKLMDQIRLRGKKIIIRNGFSIVMISIIIFSGFSSLALQSEFWYLNVNGIRKTMSGNELQAIGYLKNVLQHDSRAFTITPSRYSKDVLTFAAPAYQLAWPQLMLSSSHPDLALFTLSSFNLDHAYLYMHTRDFYIMEKTPRSWFAQHLLPMLPVVFSNKDVTIYNASRVSYPQSNSDTTMLIPSNPRDNSWLYAYDVVSQSRGGRGNYTVMYDNDDDALKSKTVILSYDPKQYYNFYDKFSSSTYNNGTHYNDNNNFNAMNSNWNVISGNWKFSSDGLHGGLKIPSGEEKVILSPLSLSPRKDLNSTITTSFRITNADPEVANYASIIYSWKDPKNYEYATINILNKAVYVYFGTVSNGKPLPLEGVPWPGLKTNLTWKNHGDLFVNMKLSIQDKSQGLSLNGPEYLRRNHDVKSGYVGLGYTRIKDIVFDYFNLQESPNKIKNMSAERIDPLLSRYIAYVKSGGNLVVLNTNGYGSIANYLFNMSDPSISIKKTKFIPMFNDSHASKASNASFSISSNTPSPALSSTSPISSINASIGDGTITYLDINPILSKLSQNKISGDTAYTCLGLYLMQLT